MLRFSPSTYTTTTVNIHVVTMPLQIELASSWFSPDNSSKRFRPSGAFFHVDALRHPPMLWGRNPATSALPIVRKMANRKSRNPVSHSRTPLILSDMANWKKFQAKTITPYARDW